MRNPFAINFGMLPNERIERKNLESVFRYLQNLQFLILNLLWRLF